jgi:uncharacterized protein (UPF0332 family)
MINEPANQKYFSKPELIKYRIERASVTLLEARKLYKDKLYMGCVNRLYYVCYHCIQALFIKKNIIAKSHSGVLKMFHKEFISTDLFPKENGKFVSNLFIKRLDSDYGVFIDFTGEEVLKFLNLTVSFLKKTEDYISTTINEK